jgi:hypothetical protein
MMQLIGLPLCRTWWARQAAFLPFRAAAAKLYEETKAADVLFDADMIPCPAAGSVAKSVFHSDEEILCR